jgi:hypothetical protein
VSAGPGDGPSHSATPPEWLPRAALLRWRGVAVSNNPDDAWDGFADAFWTLGQAILWVVTRDPARVDGASDDVGRLGESYAEAAAAIQIEALAREDILDAAKEIRRRCAHGKLEALSAGQTIEAIKWTQLEIDFDNGAPFVRRLAHSGIAAAYPDVRFSGAAVLSEFKPIGSNSHSGQKDDSDPSGEVPDQTPIAPAANNSPLARAPSSPPSIRADAPASPGILAPKTKAPPRKGKDYARQRARKAFDKLFPGDEPLIGNKDLARLINDELKRQGQQEVSPRTVLRAVGRSTS